MTVPHELVNLELGVDSFGAFIETGTGAGCAARHRSLQTLLNFFPHGAYVVATGLNGFFVPAGLNAAAVTGYQWRLLDKDGTSLPEHECAQLRWHMQDKQTAKLRCRKQTNGLCLHEYLLFSSRTNTPDGGRGDLTVTDQLRPSSRNNT
jgi:hypothetical protein